MSTQDENRELKNDEEMLVQDEDNRLENKSTAEELEHITWEESVFFVEKLVKFRMQLYFRTQTRIKEEEVFASEKYKKLEEKVLEEVKLCMTHEGFASISQILASVETFLRDNEKSLIQFC